MGNIPIQRINFEDIQFAQKNESLILNTLPSTEQSMLIAGTISWEKEIKAVELAIQKKNPIFVYGRHCNDETIFHKYEQIRKLGGNVYLYAGGLFEWLLLQDIYGIAEFPTTTTFKTVDLLKYKPPTLLNTKYLTYSWQADC
jgi:hypothetical protein